MRGDVCCREEAAGQQLGSGEQHGRQAREGGRQANDTCLQVVQHRLHAAAALGLVQKRHNAGGVRRHERARRGRQVAH